MGRAAFKAVEARDRAWWVRLLPLPPLSFPLSGTSASTDSLRHEPLSFVANGLGGHRGAHAAVQAVRRGRAGIAHEPFRSIDADAGVRNTADRAPRDGVGIPIQTPLESRLDRRARSQPPVAKAHAANSHRRGHYDGRGGVFALRRQPLDVLPPSPHRVVASTCRVDPDRAGAPAGRVDPSVVRLSRPTHVVTQMEPAARPELPDDARAHQARAHVRRGAGAPVQNASPDALAHRALDNEALGKPARSNEGVEARALSRRRASNIASRAHPPPHGARLHCDIRQHRRNSSRIPTQP